MSLIPALRIDNYWYSRSKKLKILLVFYSLNRTFANKIKSMDEQILKIAEDVERRRDAESVSGNEQLQWSDDQMVLRTEGLVKRYGKRTVVNNVSINVRQGEIVGLLGPNGAGKTTSFYMTTGLIVPNAGHIYLNDLDVTKYPVYKRARAGIGYLAQ